MRRPALRLAPLAALLLLPLAAGCAGPRHRAYGAVPMHHLQAEWPPVRVPHRPPPLRRAEVEVVVERAPEPAPAPAQEETVLYVTPWPRSTVIYPSRSYRHGPAACDPPRRTYRRRGHHRGGYHRGGYHRGGYHRGGRGRWRR